MKSLAKNSLYNVIYRCLNVVFPLITMAYIARVLYAEGVGHVSSATNIAAYFTVLAALGLPTYGTKAIASCVDKVSVSKTFWDLFTINLLSTLIFSAVYYTMIFTIPFFQNELNLFVIVGLAIIFNVINVDWFYQGREEYGYITLRSLIIKSISVITIFAFVRDSDDVVAYALILTLSNVANYLFNIIHIRKFITRPTLPLNCGEHIKPILLLLSASIIIELYTMVGTTLLTVFSVPENVGYYSNSMSIIRVVRTIVTAICAVFLPRLSYYYAIGEILKFKNLISSGLSILLYITLPVCFGVFLVAHDAVIILFGHDFYNSILLVKVLDITILTIAISNFIGYQIFITIGKEKLMLRSTIIGACINIIANILLLYFFDYVGVAMASVLAEMAVTMYQYHHLRKMDLYSPDMRFIISVISSSIVMTIVVISINCLVDNMYIRFPFSVACGIFSYFIFTIALKNEFSLNILERLFKIKI